MKAASVLGIALILGGAGCQSGAPTGPAFLKGTPLESAPVVSTESSPNRTVYVLAVDEPLDVATAKFKAYCETSKACRLDVASDTQALFQMNTGGRISMVKGRPLPGGQSDASFAATETTAVVSTGS